MSVSQLKFLRAQAWANMLGAGEVAKLSPSPLTKANHESAWHVWEALDRAFQAASAKE